MKDSHVPTFLPSVLTSLVLLTACHGDPAPGGSIAQAGCTPQDCGTGQYCADDGQCRDVAAECEVPGACSCHIIDVAGHIPATESDLRQSMPAGGAWRPQVVLRNAQGRTFPDPPHTLQLHGDNAASFAVSDDTVTATQAPGTAQVTVQVGSQVSCRATVHNLGPAPTDGRVRLFVYDAVSGQPVGGALGVVTDVDGAPAAAMAATDLAGTSLSDAAVSGHYAISVFAPDYHYVTVTGLQMPLSADIAIPLEKKTTLDGGFAGKVDFTPYEETVLGGPPKEVRVAVAGVSGPMVPLFEGAFTASSVMTDVIGRLGCEPDNIDCFRVPLQGAQMAVVFPRPMVLEAIRPIKNRFDVRARSGHHYAWTLGTEIKLADGLALMNLAVGTYGTEAGKMRALAEGAVELLPQLAVGISRPVYLPPVCADTWAQQVAIGDLNGRAPEAGVLLFTEGAGRLGALSPRQALQQRTLMQLPDFPPASDLDAVWVSTVAVAQGYGAVLLGLGFGLDALDDNVMQGGGAHDGRVNGMRLCGGSAPCPPGAASHSQDGQVALFHTPAFAGLEAHPQATLAVSTSVHELVTGAAWQPISGLVAWGPPADNQLAGRTFLPPPSPPSDLTARSYALGPVDPAVQLQMVRLQLGDDTHWTVYAAPEVQRFVAPQVPAGWDDLQTVAATSHAQVALDGIDLPHLVGYKEVRLGAFSKSIQAFAMRSGELAVD